MLLLWVSNAIQNNKSRIFNLKSHITHAHSCLQCAVHTQAYKMYYGVFFAPEHPLCAFKNLTNDFNTSICPQTKKHRSHVCNVECHQKDILIIRFGFSYTHSHIRLDPVVDYSNWIKRKLNSRPKMLCRAAFCIMANTLCCQMKWGKKAMKKKRLPYIRTV